MSWLAKVKKCIKEFKYNLDDDECFVLIPTEEEDEIIRWLADYVLSEEGNWLSYDLREIFNTSDYEILVFSL